MPEKISVRYEWGYRQDDTPVRGNATASGDDEADRACEEAILAALDRGEDWQWALVEVRAIVELDGQTFMGSTCMGGCSYATEAELKRDTFDDDEGSYGPSLKAEALADLKAYIRIEAKDTQQAVAARLEKAVLS